MAKGLAFLVFFCAATAAFCISMLCYTLVTGDLPFNLVPMVNPALKKVYGRDTNVKTNKIDLSKERVSEDYLYAFYKELSDEREKLAKEREKLAEKERNVNEIMNQARLMQTRIGESEKKLRQLLDFIDNKQQENLRRTAKMLSGMDTAGAGKMLLQWDEKKAAEVMSFVNEKQTAKIISSMMESKDKTILTKAQKIVQLMEKVSEDPNSTGE